MNYQFQKARRSFFQATLFKHVLPGIVLIASSLSWSADIECGQSKSRLYKKANVNDAVQMELLADFSNLSKNSTPLKAVLRYNDAKDGVVTLPVVLSGRGNSRGSLCTFKPFRLTFSNRELPAQIEQELLKKGIRPESKTFLHDYYTQFLSLNYDIKTEGKAPKNSLFDDLGDDVKVVTHCGVATRGGDWPGGREVLDQDQRLLMEHYLYEILNTTQLPVESTRLASVKYFDAQGKPMFTDTNADVLPKFAFFREPPTSLAKRCGLLSKPPSAVPGQPQNNQVRAEADRVSQLALNVVNSFVGNSDFGYYGEGRQGHNVNYLYDREGKRYLGAYDFDLAYSVNGERGLTLEAASAGLKSRITQGGDKATALKVTELFTSNREAMENILAHGLLNEKYRTRAKAWLDSQMKTFESVALELKAKP